MKHLFMDTVLVLAQKIVVLLKNYKSFYLGEIDNKRIIMEMGNVVGLILVLVK